MKISRYIYIIVLIALCWGCGIRTSGSGGKIKKYAESYYKGEGKILFFVKPLTFTDNKEKLSADFTFNKGDTTKQFVVVNMNVYGTPPFTLPDSVSFFFGENSYTDNSIRLLFNENLKRHPYSRQSAQLPVENFEALLTANEVTIALYYNGTKKNYISGKTWSKIHTKLYQMIFW